MLGFIIDEIGHFTVIIALLLNQFMQKEDKDAHTAERRQFYEEITQTRFSAVDKGRTAIQL